MFALHGVHVVDPGALHDPSGQHTPAPADDDRPVGQGAQTRAVADPFCGLKKPDAHCVQAASDVDPACVLYEPGGHGEHPPATAAPASDE